MLKNITDRLISVPLNYAMARQAAIDLYHYFNSLSLIKDDDKKILGHIKTDFGLAIAPDAAAICILDFMRTRNFIMAIKQAIEDKLKLRNSRPIVILYAGTGPYASLLVPLTTVFKPSEVKFILLEINEISIGHLKNVIDALKINDFIIDIIQADASNCVIEKNIEVDILLSETMKPALDKEPQVSIISNLISQCRHDVTLIPELISVDLAFKGKSNDENIEYFFIQKLLNFNASTAKNIFVERNNFPVFGDGIMVNVNCKPESMYRQLVLLTKIKLYKNIELNYNESSLTIAFVIEQLDNCNFPLYLNVKYITGKKPGFNVQLITN